MPLRRRWDIARRKTLLYFAAGIALIAIGCLVAYFLTISDKAYKIASVLALLLGIVSAIVSITIGIAGILRSPPTPPQSKLADRPKLLDSYIKRFLSVNRAPSWNSELCSNQQLKIARVHYAIVPSNENRPPAFTDALNRRQRTILNPKLMSVESVAKSIWGPRKENSVKVVLGDPGAGKSSFAVQLVQVLARKVSGQRAATVPVYVNMAHYTDSYELTTQGVTELVRDSILSGCPRYLLRKVKRDADLSDFADHLLDGEIEGLSVLVVFDGMDEMPKRGYSERVRAIADFMDARRSFKYLVTCRYEDFVELRNFTHNLRVQRLDLLPWTQRMVKSYLATKLSGNKVLQKEVLNALRFRNFSTQYYAPLEVTMLAEVGPTSGAKLHELLTKYIEECLAKQLGTSAAENAFHELAKFALSKELKNTEPITLNEKVEHAACHAGLLRSTPQGLLFEIRPIMHHLAAYEILRRVEQGSDDIPSEVTFQNVKARELFESASAQAGTSIEWLSFIVRDLGREGKIRSYGDRISVAAYALQPEQMAESPQLRSKLTQIISLLVIGGDDFERKRCLVALELQPQLLDRELSDSRVLFTWITDSGSELTVNWMLQLFACSRSLRREYKQLWRAAIRRSINERFLGRSVEFYLASRLPRSRIVRMGLTGIHILFLAIGLYAAYEISWSIATLLNYPVRYWFELPIPPFVDLWLRRHDFTNFEFQILHFLYFLVFLVMPWQLIVRRWREGLGPNTFLSRLATLILLSAGYRLTLSLTLTLADVFSSASSVVLQAIQILFYLMILTAFVLIASIIIVNPNDWAGAIKEVVKPSSGGPRTSFWRRLRNVLPKLQREGVRVPEGRMQVGDEAEEMIIVDPGRDLALSLISKYGPILSFEAALKADSQTGRTRMLVLMSVFIVLMFASFVISGPGAAAGTAALGSLALVLYAVFILPVEKAREVRNGLRNAAMNGLTADVDKYFKAVLAQVMDDENPRYVRMTLVSVLETVPFNAERYQLLHNVCETLPQDPVKTRMMDIVGQAWHQVSMDSDL